MRKSEIKRKTRETDIDLSLCVDGTGINEIKTGVGFFDHMLTAFSTHSGFDLFVKCKGDLEVDCHHTIEDIGIVLGLAFYEVIKDKTGLARYGNFTIPMDEALATCNVDISGRPYLVFNSKFKGFYMGDMEVQMVEEFFRAFTMNSKVTMHINVHYGNNDHHMCEAIFKAVAHALKEAVKIGDRAEILSSKGVI
ncbi:imidazoleglycerol-phosphate dehydratase HisB [Anaerovorax odorimutans]|uniref:imidazoleglycerol-phosphate dehydratase HisB n=1 Tax=Anaerovorax odorimutans TaxID=109327 RepID=UPI0003FF728C|nr:imidazoleglycerol-phosphate dehydratase HisB [Anaerovorax odorimutans]